MLQFKNLDIDSKKEFDKYTKNLYENSESSFANMFIWSDYLNTRYAVFNGYLIVIYTAPNGRWYSYMPYGSGDIDACIFELSEYFKENGQSLTITSASPTDADKISRAFPEVRIAENVDFNDYVYTSDALIKLSGKKLHSKKNHLNRFKNTYNYTYDEMRREDFDECLSLASGLMLKNRSRNSFTYKAEYRSIEKAFEYFSDLELCGGVIKIDGRTAAFSVGERLTDECALIHIEKADTAYSGIYAAINNEFVSHSWSDVKYINREEDMGLEGLRKAKLSYRPDHMVRKFICAFA